MERPRLHGIIPPMPTPLHKDETIDLEALTRLVNFQIGGGVHGLWVLGTTARFDLIPDSRQRQVAETVAAVAAGRVPLVLNVSDQGTERTIDNFVVSLRKKLEKDPEDPKHFVTVRGTGYRFDPVGEQS